MKGKYLPAMHQCRKARILAGFHSHSESAIGADHLVDRGMRQKVGVAIVGQARDAQLFALALA
jgi:hypothetical protein